MAQILRKQMSEHRFFPLAVPDLAVNPIWWLYVLCQEIADKTISSVVFTYESKGGRRQLGMDLLARAAILQNTIEIEYGVVGWSELNKYAIRELGKTGRVVSNYGTQAQEKVMLAIQKDGYFELKRVESNVQFHAGSGNWYILDMQDDMILYCNHKEVSRKKFHDHNGAIGVKRWLESFNFDPTDQHSWFDMQELYARLYDMFPKGKPDFSPMQNLILQLMNLENKEIAEATGGEFEAMTPGQPIYPEQMPLFWRSYHRIAGAWAFELMTKEDSGTEPMYIGGLTSFLAQLAYKWKNGWTEDIQPTLNLDNDTTRTIIHLFNDAMQHEKKDVASGKRKKHKAFVLAYMIHEYQKQNS